MDSLSFETELSDERKAELLRLNLIENVLTLKCPNCTLAFIDFDGCHNVTCHNCRLSFCAMCLNASIVFKCSTINHLSSDFGEHHRRRQQHLIREQINELPEKTGHILLRLISKELEDLGINIL